VVSIDDDVRWMRRAVEHARRGIGRTTPNPIVGAVVVSGEGVVVGQGAHEKAGEPHAEVNALDEAGDAARDATLYCTLEPCAHTGRTGPCTERIIRAGITRVVAAMADPFPLVSGKGFAALRAHGIDVTVGVERDAAVRLNQPFLMAVREGRPFVTLKAATSLDGRIAARPGERTALSSELALRHAQYVRASVDAIAVGSGTILVDDPLLTARDVYRERPLVRVVFDRRLRTTTAARLLSTVPAGPVIIITSPQAVAARGSAMTALEETGAVVLPVDTPTIGAALRRLPALGVQSIVSVPRAFHSWKGATSPRWR
jgi:diaminohydroxyphosphoribosylaminopyrimidine deaminase/5-amino-6-(5-phosphoribosylamino)uracil reductase